MIDKNMITKLINTQLEGALESLDQDQLTPEEAQDLVLDELKELLEPSLDFKEEIDFENIDDLPKDFNIARKAIMITLDRSLKLSDLAFHALATEKTNPLYLELCQDIQKSIQQATKTLSDLHTSYQKIVGQKRKNDTLIKEESKEDDNLPEGIMTSPFELIRAKEDEESLKVNYG